MQPDIAARTEREPLFLVPETGQLDDLTVYSPMGIFSKTNSPASLLVAACSKVGPDRPQVAPSRRSPDDAADRESAHGPSRGSKRMRSRPRSGLWQQLRMPGQRRSSKAHRFSGAIEVLAAFLSNLHGRAIPQRSRGQHEHSGRDAAMPRRNLSGGLGARRSASGIAVEQNSGYQERSRSGCTARSISRLIKRQRRELWPRPSRRRHAAAAIVVRAALVSTARKEVSVAANRRRFGCHRHAGMTSHHRLRWLA